MILNEMGGVLYLLQTKVLTQLGGLSFPIYMSHYIFIQWWWAIADHYSINRELFVGALVCFIMALLFAFIYSKYVEPKILSLLKK